MLGMVKDSNMAIIKLGGDSGGGEMSYLRGCRGCRVKEGEDTRFPFVTVNTKEYHFGMVCKDHNEIVRLLITACEPDDVPTMFEMECVLTNLMIYWLLTRLLHFGFSTRRQEHVGH
ncbi:hypothetical protein Tco_0699053 [Tanacetum coccineum]